MTTLFISDLHLQSQRPHITRAFFNLLHHQARDADALYILGDLFDVWIGDDERTPLQNEVAAEIAALVKHGTPVYLIHGNRDFMIGDDYCQRAGLTLLPDPSTIDLYGQRALLMHGDSLCTDDKGYQRYRRFIRSSFIRWLQDYVSLTSRQKIGRLIRGKSAETNQYKSRALQDINRDAAREAMERSQATVLIHGHTHRPGVDPIGTRMGQGERIVLGDWDTRGWCLRWHADGSRELAPFDIEGSP
ncbi:UDP-2,3-diacylglucosamine diphosphatase [Motiliproteus sediminis]|uniref:UDP-2,3-diacylglucosamine diphosphatase n=1 Tax=Motiliproteus sediminis TaxID=1468178 RepID=UPI001AEF6ECE|nr:UDP-2,3-diacylglucosamine diphosphatase [Motiliproteus sediminis]